MFIEYVANKCTPSELSTNNVWTRGGRENYVALPAAEGFDFVTLVWHLTQTAGTTQGSFQGALSTDGPWIDLFAVNTVNLADSGYKQIPKFPLFRFQFALTGTTMVFTGAVVA